MVALTVRNISDETHRALKYMARQHGCSTEAEIRRILDQSVKPEKRVKLGTLLMQIGKEVAWTDAESQAFEDAIKRDKTSSELLEF